MTEPVKLKCRFCGETNPRKFWDFEEKKDKYNNSRLMKQCKIHFYCKVRLFDQKIEDGMSREQALAEVVQYKDDFFAGKVAKAKAKRRGIKESEEDCPDSDEEREVATMLVEQEKPKKKVVFAKSDGEEEDEKASKREEPPTPAKKASPKKASPKRLTFTTEKIPVIRPVEAGMKLFEVVFQPEQTKFIPMVTSALERLHKIKLNSAAGNRASYMMKVVMPSLFEFKDKLMSACDVLNIKPYSIGLIELL